MSTEDRFWQIILTVVGLLTAFVPAYVSYDLYGRGGLPERKIELEKMSVIDPLQDLSSIGNTVSLQIRSKSESQELDNIFIAKVYLKNAGQSPILPSDYYEKISVNVKKPWKILAVGSGEQFRNVNFKWNRVADERFEAVPALLNPGDMVSVNVYLTNTEYKIISSDKKREEPNIEWQARILNMTELTNAPVRSINFSSDRWWDVASVNLSGIALPFTICIAMLFLALYLHLLSKVSIIVNMRGISIAIVLGVSFLSFAVAESMATYLFGSFLTKLFGGVNHWMNAPWIILHVIILIFLYVKGRNHARISS